ncbi:hypothetical protein M1446_04105 [Candidatus Dependentiae bacterium]|nr:hypothetical protein [Candidatus Dependentiae bacterium]
MKKFLLALIIFKISFCMEQQIPNVPQTTPGETHIININSDFQDLKKLIKEKKYIEILRKLRSSNLNNLSKEDGEKLVKLIKNETKIINNSQESNYYKLYIFFFLTNYILTVTNLVLSSNCENSTLFWLIFASSIISYFTVSGQEFILTKPSVTKQNELEKVDDEKRAVLNILNPL